jgi:uncharacterized protein YjiS (DUF1127 family)
MSTLTFDRETGHEGAEAGKAATPGFWERVERIFARAIKAREAYARRRVDGYLASLNDATLIDIGLDPAEVRRRHRVPPLPLYL